MSLLFITGYEAMTGKTLDGSDGQTVSNLVTAKGSNSDEETTPPGEGETPPPADGEDPAKTE